MILFIFISFSYYYNYLNLQYGDLKYVCRDLIIQIIQNLHISMLCLTEGYVSMNFPLKVETTLKMIFFVTHSYRIVNKCQFLDLINFCLL